jgi:hypothetical protein
VQPVVQSLGGVVVADIEVAVMGDIVLVLRHMVVGSLHPGTVQVEVHIRR